MGLAGQHGAQLLELATIGRGTRIGWQARHRSTLRRRSVDELEAIPVGQPQFALRTDEPGLDQIGVGTTGTCRQRHRNASAAQRRGDRLLAGTGRRIRPAHLCALERHITQQAVQEIDKVRGDLPSETALVGSLQPGRIGLPGSRPLVKAQTDLDAAQSEGRLGDGLCDQADRIRRSKDEVDRLRQTAAIHRLGERLAGLNINTQRLFAKDRLAGSDRRANIGFVRQGRHTDIDHIDIKALDRLGRTAAQGQSGVSRRGGRPGLRRIVISGHHLQARDRRCVLEHAPADHAQTDHRHAKRLHRQPAQRMNRLT